MRVRQSSNYFSSKKKWKLRVKNVLSGAHLVTTDEDGDGTGKDDTDRRRDSEGDEERERVLDLDETQEDVCGTSDQTGEDEQPGHLAIMVYKPADEQDQYCGQQIRDRHYLCSYYS